MTTPTPNPKEALAGLVRRYRSGFAGHPRVTRDASVLEGMLAELSALRTGAESAADAQDLARQIDDLTASWTGEVAAIREAQSAPAHVLSLQSIEQWLDEVLGRYRRNFAGYSRPTRDLGMLSELANDLSWLLRDVEAVKAAHPDAASDDLKAAIERSLAMMKSEQEEIRKARRSGSTAGRASGLAQLANDQFSRYRLHFAGQLRGTRRQASLAAIVWSLEEILREMRAISLEQADAHTKNIDIVKRRIDAYREELVAIVAAVDGMTPDGRTLALGDAANKIMIGYRDAFAGKPRSEVDEELLNGMWEKLWAVARELSDLAEESDGPSLRKNLQLVRDTLRMFSREHQAIVDAKKTAVH